jgi:hypothetical protein
VGQLSVIIYSNYWSVTSINVQIAGAETLLLTHNKHINLFKSKETIYHTES